MTLTLHNEGEADAKSDIEGLQTKSGIIHDQV